MMATAAADDDISHVQQTIDAVFSLEKTLTSKHMLRKTVQHLLDGLLQNGEQGLKDASPEQIQQLCKIASRHVDADTLAKIVGFQYRNVPKSIDHLAAAVGVIDMMAGLNQLDPDSAANALASLVEVAKSYRRLTAGDIEALTDACARYPWIKVPPLAAAAPPSPSPTPEAPPALAAAPSAPAAKPPKTPATAAPPTMCRLSVVKPNDNDYDARFSTAVVGFVKYLTDTPSWLGTTAGRGLIADAIEMFLRLDTCIDTPTLGELASVIRDLNYRYDGFKELEALMDVYSEQRFAHPAPDPSAVNAVLVRLLDKTDAIVSRGVSSLLFIFCAAVKPLMASEFNDFAESTLDRIADTVAAVREALAFSDSAGVLADSVTAWINQMRSKNLERQQMTALATLLRKRKRDAEDDEPKPKRVC